MPHRIVFVLGAPNDTRGHLSAIALGRADKALEVQRQDPRVRITAVNESPRAAEAAGLFGDRTAPPAALLRSYEK